MTSGPDLNFVSMFKYSSSFIGLYVIFCYLE